jgi:hypothetical protein
VLLLWSVREDTSVEEIVEALLKAGFNVKGMKEGFVRHASSNACSPPSQTRLGVGCPRPAGDLPVVSTSQPS